MKKLGIALIFFTFISYTNLWNYPDEVDNLWELFSFWKLIFFAGIVILGIDFFVEK